MIRLAEVYLIAAESSLPYNAADALMYLTALMANRDPGFTYPSSDPTLIYDIVTERRKELAFEGDRLYDLNRLQLPINRIANAGAIPLNANYLSIPFPVYRRIAPTPQAEINTNPNIAPDLSQVMPHFCTMGRYFARFSMITQARTAIRAKAMGRPDGAILILASRIPVKMGTRTTAPG